MSLPDYLTAEILADPSKRKFDDFSLSRLLGTVFEPTEGCKICILTDFDDPAVMMKDHAYLKEEGFPVQKNAYKHFYQSLKDSVMDCLLYTSPSPRDGLLSRMPSSA